MAKHIPRNENQRPATKTTLPTRFSIKIVGQIRSFPEKKSKILYVQQTTSATDAKLTIEGKEGKEKERGSQVGKNGNE